jgi:hypothetical protein
VVFVGMHVLVLKGINLFMRLICSEIANFTGKPDDEKVQAAVSAHKTKVTLLHLCHFLACEFYLLLVFSIIHGVARR